MRMIIALLTTLFILLCFFMILLILLQRGKNNMGIGSMGSNQMLFGASGGQDIFQKATWVCLVLFMGGSLAISMLRNHASRQSKYLSSYQRALPKQNESSSNSATPSIPSLPTE